jgi:hypothetical protein
MNLSEKELEQLIMSKFESKKDRIELGERGLQTKQTTTFGDYSFVNTENQVNLHGYGIADIISTCIDSDSCIHIDIFELKARPLKINDIAQVMRYRQGVDSFMEYLVSTGDLEQDKHDSCAIQCNLVGSGFDDDIKYFLSGQNSIDDLLVSFFVYNFDAFNGLTFKDYTANNYYLNEPNFNNNISKDEEKYNFISMIYSCRESIHLQDKKQSTEGVKK